MGVAVDPNGPGRRWSGRESERPVLLFAAESSEDEATVRAEALAQQVAVGGECTGSRNLVALVAEVVALDLDVLPA